MLLKLLDSSWRRFLIPEKPSTVGKQSSFRKLMNGLDFWNYEVWTWNCNFTVHHHIIHLRSKSPTSQISSTFNVTFDLAIFRKLVWGNAHSHLDRNRSNSEVVLGSCSEGWQVQPQARIFHWKSWRPHASPHFQPCEKFISRTVWSAISSLILFVEDISSSAASGTKHHLTEMEMEMWQRFRDALFQAPLSAPISATFQGWWASSIEDTERLYLWGSPICESQWLVLLTGITMWRGLFQGSGGVWSWILAAPRYTDNRRRYSNEINR